MSPWTKWIARMLIEVFDMFMSQRKAVKEAAKAVGMKQERVPERGDKAKEEGGGGFGSFVFGLLMGGLLGSGLALLYAPQAGEETREQLKAKAEELKQQAEKELEQARVQAEKTLAEASARVDEATEQIEGRAREMRDQAKSAADKAEAQFEEAVDTAAAKTKKTIDQAQKKI